METNKNIEPRIDIDDYLEKPYWVVDILPRQVPPNANGQFFRIEDYLLKHPQIDAIYKKFFHVLLKLNCYDDMAYGQNGENWSMNPSPQDVERMMTCCMQEKSMLYVWMASSRALIVLSPDDTHLTVYSPTKEVLELIGALAAAEGLFVWKPCAM